MCFCPGDEMVDLVDSKSAVERRASSSLARGTIRQAIRTNISRTIHKLKRIAVFRLLAWPEIQKDWSAFIMK